MAAQFRWNLIDGRDIASLENLFDCPAYTLCKTKQVIDLLRRCCRIGVAVLPVLSLLVLLWLRLLVVGLRIIILLLYWLRLDLWRHLRRCHLLSRRGIVQFGFDGFSHEVKDTVDFLLKLLSIKAIGQLHFDLAVVLLR